VDVLTSLEHRLRGDAVNLCLAVEEELHARAALGATACYPANFSFLWSSISPLIGLLEVSGLRNRKFLDTDRTVPKLDPSKSSNTMLVSERSPDQPLWRRPGCMITKGLMRLKPIRMPTR